MSLGGHIGLGMKGYYPIEPRFFYDLKICQVHVPLHETIGTYKGSSVV